MASQSRSAPRHRDPVLLIGLDAAEISLIEMGIANGSLPTLARLRNQGGFGRLDSPADWLVGAPWPSFYTSSWPSDHGFVSYLQWRSGLMTHVRPDASWLPLRPFWRELATARAITIDVPLAFAPAAGSAIEVCGWSSHDKLWPPASNPAGMLKSIYREFGRSPVPPEVAGLQSGPDLLRERDHLLQAISKTADLSVALMERHPWDLFLVVFSATHRGGHRIWDRTGLAEPLPSRLEAEFDDALPSLYRACDAAVARILERAPANTRLLVFSLHGMGVNQSRCAVFPEMLARILDPGKARSFGSDESSGFLRRIRRRIPVRWRSALKSRLPQQLQDRLALFWHQDLKLDWSRTRAIPYLADLEAYVQVNQIGRERDGIIPETDVSGLLAEISEALTTFVDQDTGAPIIQGIGRPCEVFPPGPNLHLLPDLIVRWRETPAARHHAVVSPRYGRIPWPTPGKNPDGRSGHHRSTGWVIATGAGIAPGSVLPRASVLDLAPTALALLDEPEPYPMRGRQIQEIVAGTGVLTR
jgi:predicted AlkP superfamily phosphohydrolase/phosphomutase